MPAPQRASATLIGLELDILGVNSNTGATFIDTTIVISETDIEFAGCLANSAEGCVVFFTIDFDATGVDFLVENQSTNSNINDAAVITYTGFMGLSDVILVSSTFPAILDDACTANFSPTVLTCDSRDYLAPAGSVFAARLDLVVPEPGTLGLLSAGLLALGFARRRRA